MTLEQDTETLNNFPYSSSAEMTSKGIRLKVKCQGHTLDLVKSELVRLYVVLEEEFRKQGITPAPAEFKNGVKANGQ
jgi:hypothetical protein